MKHFTLLFAALFCSFNLVAQEVVIEELWNHSVGATETDLDDPFLAKPGYTPEYINIGSETERSIAYFDGKLYIPSRASVTVDDELIQMYRIAVVDATDGSLIKYIDVTDIVDGGTFPMNQIAIDEDGIMVLTNLITSAEPGVRVYTADLKEADPTVTLAFEVPNPEGYRLGDGIGFYGYLKEGESILLLPVGGTDAERVIRVDINNGNYVGKTEVILDPITEGGETFGGFILGTAPQIIDVNENNFIVKGTQAPMARFDYDGEMIEQLQQIEGGNYAGIPHDGLNGGKIFTFNETDYLLTIAVNSEGAPLASIGQGREGTFVLIEVPADGISGDLEVVSLLPEDIGLQGFSGTKQVAVVAPVAVDIRDCKAYLYIMYPKAGVAAYKMSIEGCGTDNINETISTSLGAYPNPVVDVLNITGDPAVVVFYSVAGQKVMSVENQASINVSSLQGIYLVKITDKSGESVTVKVSVK